MASESGIHFTAFAAEYKAILARARQTVAGFPPLLRDLARADLSQLAAGNFSQIVALLPYWVAALLDKEDAPDRDGPPAQPKDTETLGLASFLGWGAYQIHDGLLDRELDRPESLPLALAFHAAAIRLLAQLLPGDKGFWAAFQALSLESAEAHCWEQGRHFQTLANLDSLEIDPGAFDLDDPDRLAARSAPLRLAVVAQLSLRGYVSEHPLGTALDEMLRQYTMARQIGDDRTDWAKDLRRGRLNYVSARILRRMVETGAVHSAAELDADRLAGYFLYDDDLFADIQGVALAACQRAAQAIAPYHSLYLTALVDDLAKQTVHSYQVALEARRKTQGLFAPLYAFP